jgi:tetrathionate reductase subunit B
VAACPYGALYLDPVTQIADKCDFCSHRLSAGMEPACVETCPAGTLRFGNLNDPLDSLAKFVAAHPEELSVLKPEKGTQPRVLYRNLDRSMEKKVAEGRNHDPRQYEVETWEMEGRLEAPGKPPKGA